MEGALGYLRDMVDELKIYHDQNQPTIENKCDINESPKSESKEISKSFCKNEVIGKMLHTEETLSNN